MSLGLSEGILAITGYGYVGLRNALALMVADVILLFVLIPHWGLMGAAFATSTTTVVVTVWRALQTRRLLGLYMSVPAHLLIVAGWGIALAVRSEEHTSELQSLMRISYAVFCLKKKT